MIVKAGARRISTNDNIVKSWFLTLIDVSATSSPWSHAFLTDKRRTDFQHNGQVDRKRCR